MRVDCPLITFSYSSLTSRLPPLPKGFDIDSIWDTSISINPVAIYVVAIKVMYALGGQSWSEPVELQESGLVAVYEPPNMDTVIYTTAIQDIDKFTTGLCVQALYQAVNNMATREPGFYKSTNIVTWNDVPIGSVSLVDLSRQGLGLALNVTTNITDGAQIAQSEGLAIATRTTSASSTPTADSGEILDDASKDLKIQYQYTGSRIQGGDLFSAALDGLAHAALFDHDGPCDSITALSVSRNLVWHVGRNSDEKLFTGEISRVFYLLVRDLYLVQRRFQEIWFSLIFEGTSIADGYVYKWNGAIDAAVQ